MAHALHRGYATASTDTGHKGEDTGFLIGHPEKVIDFAYRALHEMTVASKSLTATFYGRAPQLSYYQGCSTGGRQGLMAAQRYPEDFDGIIAGAPVYNMIHLNASVLTHQSASSRTTAGKCRRRNSRGWPMRSARRATVVMVSATV